MNLGFLASGRGSNFQAVVDACASGKIEAKPVLVVSNNSSAHVLQRASTAGIATMHISSVTHPDNHRRDRTMRDAFIAQKTDLIVLVGYVKKLGPETLREFDKKIINVHPALLPKFGGKGMYGMRVHEAVIAAGETQTGATVHLVDSEYDTGATLAQTSVPILEGDCADDIATRVLEQEHALLVETLARICTGERPLESQLVSLASRLI